ncbi:MAG: hypothetical protein QGH60_20980 [Phycisphaerae bacterium]|nr:hypothetical protein [Phycisphaerae bacterium]
MQVLAQLSQKGPLREILSQIPTALHQHSNAVVIIAPPEAMELFERLANELDQPSAFHERMARSRKPGGPSCRGNCSQNNCPTPGRCSGCRGNCRRTNRPSPGKSPGCSGECGGANRPSPRKEPAEINAEAIKRAIGDPVGQLLRKVLSSGELRLDKQQRGAIHKIAQQCGQKVGHMHQRVIQAIRGMGRDERASNARKTVSHARAAMGNMAGEVRKHIFKILKPSQHKTAARILGAPGPAGNKGAKPSKCCGKCPKSKTRAKGGCGGCGSKNKAGAKGGCGGCRGKGKPTPTAAPRGCGSSPRPTAVPGKPRPQAAPSGCGGCGTRGIVLGDTGNCKTSDF